MTFARGSIRGYDDDRMVLLFSMMDGSKEIACAISSSAMDDLERAEAQRLALTQRYLTFFDTYDLLLTPATIVAPYPVGQRHVAIVRHRQHPRRRGAAPRLRHSRSPGARRSPRAVPRA